MSAFLLGGKGRYRGDTGEIQGRYRGDTGEIQGRYRGDLGHPAADGAAPLLLPPTPTLPLIIVNPDPTLTLNLTCGQAAARARAREPSRAQYVKEMAEDLGGLPHVKRRARPSQSQLG